MNQDAAEKIKAMLARIGIGTHEVKAYGSQLTIECLSRNTADSAARIIGQAFKIRGIVEALVDAKENKGTCLQPTKRRVWRLYACVAEVSS